MVIEAKKANKTSFSPAQGKADSENKTVSMNFGLFLYQKSTQ